MYISNSTRIPQEFHKKPETGKLRDNTTAPCQDNNIQLSRMTTFNQTKHHGKLKKRIEEYRTLNISTKNKLHMGIASIKVKDVETLAFEILILPKIVNIFRYLIGLVYLQEIQNYPATRIVTLIPLHISFRPKKNTN